MHLFLLVTIVDIVIKKYCNSVIFHVWYYKKLKTTKICAINYGACHNTVRSQLPKNTTKHYSSSWSINAQWMHTMNMLCSQEIPGGGQRFELQSCRQMLACGRPRSQIPWIPDLRLQGCQIVIAPCSWRKEPPVLGLNALQICTCSKDSWSIRKLLLQRQDSNLEIFQISYETWTSRVVHQEAITVKEPFWWLWETKHGYLHFAGLILPGGEVVIYY